ncbi:glutathione S-transferase family protein [Halomonas sp. DN3]|uniref:glutathione S-transferase family protein n=1 Tax=Halomonas sp. DN3 TaxID=2953657 RepID=UPI00209D35C3|nr:glutathione S-transferase family protein [Halomonas sp. DN3]USZ48492.1 glutathione S-transferase family protein [Halomonas sp. DN3]
MYVLHIANRQTSSWSLRAWLTLRQLEIPFELAFHPFDEQGNSHADFRRFSPSGRVPCLHHDQRVVWDSLAIIEYLAERHSEIWPEHVDARCWARSACAEMHSGFGALRQQCPMHCALRVRLNEKTPELLDDLHRLDELLEDGLTRFGGPYLCGEQFTAADAFFAPIAFRMRTYDLPMGGPSRDYLERLLALPAMRQWQSEAVCEPFRELPLEAQILASGTVLKDLR